MDSDQSKILVRTDRLLHRRLLNHAKVNQQSLNELCLERLSIPSSLEGRAHELGRHVVAKADLIFKGALKGVIFYGSQARKEGRKDSDWDFLVVIDESIDLKREIYRKWDNLWPLELSQKVEVHFAQTPKSTAVATGFWSEIALDGIVLFERDFAVSLHLIRIRHEIANGVIMRQTIHGQSYWIRKEVA